MTTYTIVGTTEDLGESVVDHIEAESVATAIHTFREQRGEGAGVIAVFEGLLEDLCPQSQRLF